MEDMQQLGVGATLGENSNKNRIKHFTKGFQSLDFCPPMIQHRAAANLVCNDVQLYDTSWPGSGLLADNVEHFAH